MTHDAKAFLRAVWPAVVVLGGCGPDPNRLWEQARSDWSAGRLDRAETGLARLEAVRPLSLTERLLRVQVARDRGRLDDALAVLGEPAPGATKAEAAVVASTRGTLDLLRHSFRDAEASLERALTLDPTRAEAHRELIHLFALQGRQTELAAQFRALTRVGPASLTFADLYLWTLGRREDVGPSELAETLAKAVGVDPGDRTSRLALAENLRRLGRLHEARESLEPLPASDPDARAARARIALDLGDNDEAERLLSAADDAPATTQGPPGPGHPASARLRGRLALARGDARAAAAAFREALQTAPDDRDTRFGLGQALRLAGDGQAARPHTQAARDRDRLEWLVQNARPPARRNDPDALRAVGDACHELGRRDEARAWYRLALAADPLDPDLQKRLFQLDAEAPAAPPSLR